jgi:hypothetical protein
VENWQIGKRIKEELGERDWSEPADLKRQRSSMGGEREISSVKGGFVE